MFGENKRKIKAKKATAYIKTYEERVSGRLANMFESDKEPSLSPVSKYTDIEHWVTFHHITEEAYDDLVEILTRYGY